MPEVLRIRAHRGAARQAVDGLENSRARARYTCVNGPRTRQKNVGAEREKGATKNKP